MMQYNCDTKIHYRSVRSAWPELRKLTNPYDPRPLVIYICPICEQYLIGHHDW